MSDDKKEIDNTIKNQLNKLIDILQTNVKELRREYKNLNLDDKLHKMFCVFLMDKFDIKRAVNDIYTVNFTKYNNDEIALYNTMVEVEDYVDRIEGLLEVDEESDDERSESRSGKDNDKRSKHRQN